MTRRLGLIGRRGAVIVAAAVAAASVTAGALAATSPVPGKSAANAVAGPRRATSRDVGTIPASKFPHHRAASAVPAGSTSYPSFGITLTPAAPLLEPALSAGAAAGSFAEQNVPSAVLGPLLVTATPSIAYDVVTESEPTYPGVAPGSSYPAWVVTYHNSPPQDYGPTPLLDPAAMSCDFVGILDLDNQAWTDFFQSCN